MRIAKATPLIGCVALLLLALTFLLVARPTEPAVASGPDPRLAGEWLLSSASDHEGKLNLGDAYVTLTIRQRLSATGRGPCNNYDANLVGAPGPIFVTVVKQHFQQCPVIPHWTLDERYIADLRSATFASVTANELRLSSPHARLVFRRAPINNTTPLVGVTWAADYNNTSDTDGTVLTTSRVAGSLQFEADHSFQLTEQGCPVVTGHWAQNAGEIVVSSLKDDTDACSPLGDFRDRDYLLKAMKPGFEFILNSYGSTLTLLEPKSGTAWQFEESQ